MIYVCVRMYMYIYIYRGKGVAGDYVVLAVAVCVCDVCVYVYTVVCRMCVLLSSVLCIIYNKNEPVMGMVFRKKWGLCAMSAMFHPFSPPASKRIQLYTHTRVHTPVNPPLVGFITRRNTAQQAHTAHSASTEVGFICIV